MAKVPEGFDFEGPGARAMREATERARTDATKRAGDHLNGILTGDPRFTVPPLPKPTPPVERAFRTLRKEIEAFEAELDAGQVIALRISGGSSLIHVHTVRFDPPNVLIFDGTTPDGERTVAIQHVEQLNLQIVVVQNVEAEPYRIGFV